MQNNWDYQENCSIYKDRSYWNIQNLRAQNPSELGLCSREELELIITKHREKQT